MPSRTYICGWCPRLTGHPCQKTMTVNGETYTCRGVSV